MEIKMFKNDALYKNHYLAYRALNNEGVSYEYFFNMMEACEEQNLALPINEYLAFYASKNNSFIEIVDIEFDFLNERDPKIEQKILECIERSKYEGYVCIARKGDDLLESDGEDDGIFAFGEKAKHLLTLRGVEFDLEMGNTHMYITVSGVVPYNVCYDFSEDVYLIERSEIRGFKNFLKELDDLEKWHCMNL